MELALISPPLLGEGRPVLTLVELSRYYLDDFSGASMSEYQFFEGERDVTAAVASANHLQLTSKGAIRVSDGGELVFAYGKHRLGDELGFDVVLAIPTDHQVIIQRTSATMQ